MLKFTGSLEPAIVVEALGAGMWVYVGGADIEYLVVGKLVLCGSVLAHLTKTINPFVRDTKEADTSLFFL